MLTGNTPVTYMHVAVGCIFIQLLWPDLKSLAIFGDGKTGTWSYFSCYAFMKGLYCKCDSVCHK